MYECACRHAPLRVVFIQVEEWYDRRVTMYGKNDERKVYLASDDKNALREAQTRCVELLVCITVFWPTTRSLYIPIVFFTRDKWVCSVLSVYTHTHTHTHTHAHTHTHTLYAHTACTACVPEYVRL